ncbi:ATPase H(+)-transporting accessory protein 2 isoform X2 [Nomia melanderi]|uniref:ATPase H(+)-transporting accessory protein 2 isoform X2 n=1 Tax=Nomia melanderi TaxID=2448451 RepID=UPI00130438E6|nr:ATPase H(+)-transporting accessory protein 2 isoform X1 [Nomia melanderi]
MLKTLVCFVAAFVAVKANGEFLVLHSPSTVQFNGKGEVNQSLLTEVFTAALGYTAKLKGTWDGMSITDPFNLAEAVVVISIEGIYSLNTSKGTTFPLNVNEGEETTWQALRQRLDERDDDNMLVRINLSDGIDALGQSALGELKPTPIDETSLKALNLRKEEDRKFLEEVQLLHAIAKKAPSAIKPDSKPDIYWLVVSGLQPIFDAYGNNSTTSKEALSLLNNALNVISDAFIQAYDGQVLIVATTNDASKVHHIRSVTLGRQRRDTATQNEHQGEEKKIEEEEDSDSNIGSTTEFDSLTRNSTASSDSGVTESDQDNSNMGHNTNSNTKIIGQVQNLSKKYSPNYPVIFNIFLWFGIIFVFSLLAICIAISEMDPGRDSIIYRMTSNRMKKDN